MLHTLYRGLTHLSGPAIQYYLARRKAAGKEDPVRHPERLGEASRLRPHGRLVWCHAASVGESLSILVLIDRLLALDPGLSVMVTTGTVTSAELMGRRLPLRAFHQYIPVDHPAWVARFLDHWQPDLALWVESEIWPNLLWEIGRRHIPAALINARLSARSYARWRRLPGLIRDLLAPFHLILAQTEADAGRLMHLSRRDVVPLGNLKFSSEPPPADAADLARLGALTDSRPVWLFASTHPGEESLAAEVHQTLASRLPDLLTLVVPRHPHRGEEVAMLLAAGGLTVSRRSIGDQPVPTDAIHVGDTLGEMGLYYRLAPVVCMGGSFIPHGGQNPVEPARLGCAIVYGPHMFNFGEVTAQLEAADAALSVADAASLAEVVGRLLTDDAERRRRAAAAQAVAERNTQVVDLTVTALRPLLAEAGLPVTP